MEYDMKKVVKDFEIEISDLKLQISKDHKETKKLNQILDEKEKVIT